MKDRITIIKNQVKITVSNLVMYSIHLKTSINLMAFRENRISFSDDPKPLSSSWIVDYIKILHGESYFNDKAVV